MSTSVSAIPAISKPVTRPDRYAFAQKITDHGHHDTYKGRDCVRLGEWRMMVGRDGSGRDSGYIFWRGDRWSFAFRPVGIKSHAINRAFVAKASAAIHGSKGSEAAA